MAIALVLATSMRLSSAGTAHSTLFGTGYTALSIGVVDDDSSIGVPLRLSLTLDRYNVRLDSPMSSAYTLSDDSSRSFLP